MSITRDQALARIAGIIAERSTCSRKSVGCIIAREGRIIATGYNGAASGMPHCQHECSCRDSGRIQFDQLNCPRHDSGLHCSVAIHAECNAIAFAARHGIATQDASLYTTMAPCYACAGLILNAGITKIYLGHPYGNPTGRALLDQASVKKKLEVVAFPLT